MKINLHFAALLTPASFTAGRAQALDKARLDQFFDRLANNNKAMASLTIAKGGNVRYTRTIGCRALSGAIENDRQNTVRVSLRPTQERYGLRLPKRLSARATGGPNL